MTAERNTSMKPLAVALILLVAGCAGRLSSAPPATAAPAIGWIDFDRVAAESALGKRLSDEHATVIKSRNEEVQKIGQQFEAAQKAKDKQLDTMRATAQQKFEQFKADIAQHEAKVKGELVAAVKPVAATLADEHHLTRVDFEAHLWAAGDLTGEVIRRLDAADAKGMAEELAKAKAELTAARAKK
jgi:Skp family chaperone for outer membrane proteins